jgi:hypothetical protein
MKFSGRKYNKAEHWFDEERMLKKKETEMTLVEYKVKDDDVDLNIGSVEKSIIVSWKKEKIMARKAIRVFKQYN